MTKISNEMIHASYDLAKKVHDGTLSQNKGLDELVGKHEMNRNSAADYFHNYVCMIEGRRFSRTNNAYGTEYFLKNMLRDGGRSRLLNALSALRQHIDYYEAIGKSISHKQRAICETYSSIAQVAIVEIFPDEVNETSDSLLEGKARKVSVNVYERNPVARQQCIDHYGCKCFICDFDFEKVYGDIGHSFIHVHHLVELSAIGSQYSIDPVEDLRPVCPNCHSMIHKRKPSYTIKDIENYITNR